MSIQKKLTGVFLCGTLACLPLHGMAQDATDDTNDDATNTQTTDKAKQEGDAKAPSEPAIVEPVVKAGEIRVDGKVTALISGALITINVMSFTTPAGKTVELSETKSKSIQLRVDTNYHERADATKKLAFEDLKLNRRISVIGKDMGSGEPLPAREIVMWPERDGNIKTLGVVQVNGETARLLTRGQDAFQIHDATAALKLFERAADAAQAQRDTKGQALSLDWAGSALSELEQLDKALEIHQRALVLWHESGDQASEALSLNHIATVYMRQKEGAKAVDALERATQLLGNKGSKKQFILTWGNLANAYMRVKEKEKAIAALSQVLPMVRGQNDKSEEASVLSGLAYLLAANTQKEKAQATIDELVPLLDSVDDKRELASTLDQIGMAYSYMEQADKSLEFYRRALNTFNDLGDKAGAAHIQENIDRLTKGDAAKADGAQAKTDDTQDDE